MSLYPGMFVETCYNHRQQYRGTVVGVYKFSATIEHPKDPDDPDAKPETSSHHFRWLVPVPEENPP